MKYLQLFHDGLDSFEVISDEDAGKLIKAIIAHNKSQDIVLEGALNGLLMMFKNEIDRTKEAYTNKCLKNKANGSKGGRPKTQNNRTVNLESEITQDKDKDKDKDKYITPYEAFIIDLKTNVTRKSKVTVTKEGKKLFKSITDTQKLKVDYIKHCQDKGEFAQRITPYMQDYNPVAVVRKRRYV